MSNFSTNWALNGSMYSIKKRTKIDEPIILSKETQKKIKLIKKAFH
jgi:hypothetical protein